MFYIFNLWLLHPCTSQLRYSVIEISHIIVWVYLIKWLTDLLLGLTLSHTDYYRISLLWKRQSNAEDARCVFIIISLLFAFHYGPLSWTNNLVIIGLKSLRFVNTTRNFCILFIVNYWRGRLLDELLIFIKALVVFCSR